ncbi:unnamed protein product [Paramecium sonneborni]|uniref:Uncharacterized protein n=1 Tax=Paramecium sonneborni TaxID=65129 RepID=A0A8S1RA99_9CILI|nr:unnamed protein product [Paramecium sonneborni]
MNSARDKINKFQQDLMVDKNVAINTLSHYNIKEISELSWQLNQELQRFQQEIQQQISENSILKDIVKKILDLLTTNYTNQEFEKLCQGDKITFENIKNRYKKPQKLDEKPNEKLNEKPNEKLNEKLNFEKPNEKLNEKLNEKPDEKLQQKYDELFQNYKGLFSRNLKFYEDHKAIIEAQQCYINSLKNEQEKFRKQVFDYQNCISDILNTQSYEINIYPGYENLCNQINDYLKKIKVQSQDIKTSVDNIQKIQKQTNEDQKKLEEDISNIINLINEVQKISKQCSNIMQNNILQNDEKMEMEYKKISAFIQLNSKVFERFQILLNHLLRNSKELEAKNKSLSEQLMKSKNEVLQEKSKYLQTLQNFQQNYNGSKNQNQAISIKIPTYYNLFKEFSGFVLTLFEQLPQIKQSNVFKDQLINYYNNINPAPKDITEIQAKIAIFQKLLENLQNQITLQNNITQPLNNSIQFVKKYLKLPDLDKLTENDIFVAI